MVNPKRILAAALLICLCTAAAPVYADKIYAGLYTGTGVSVVDPATLDAWGEIKTGVGVAYLAKSGRYVYATQFEGDGVVVIDPAKDELVKSLKLRGKQPYHVNVTTDGLIVVETASGTVTVIDPDSQRELGHTDCPAAVYALAITPNGDMAYAGGEEGKLWVIALDNFKIVKELSIPRQVYQILITPSGDRLIVNSLEDSEVTIFSLPGMKPLKKLKAGSHGLALTPDGGELWYGGEGGKIDVYSFAEDKVVAELDRDADANLDIVFSPDGKRAYVSPAGPELHYIYVYNSQSKDRVGVIHLKEMPRGLLYIEDIKE